MIVFVLNDHNKRLKLKKAMKNKYQKDLNQKLLANKLMTVLQGIR